MKFRNLKIGCYYKLGVQRTISRKYEEYYFKVLKDHGNGTFLFATRAGKCSSAELTFAMHTFKCCKVPVLLGLIKVGE